MSLNYYPGEICTSVYLYRIQKNDKDSCCNCNNINKKYLTLGGPIIIPVQCVRVMSSSFSRPQLIVPSPTPFWPCSSSSKRRKFRGTTETRFITVLFTIAFIHRDSRNEYTRATNTRPDNEVMDRGGH